MAESWKKGRNQPDALFKKGGLNYGSGDNYLDTRRKGFERYDTFISVDAITGLKSSHRTGLWPINLTFNLHNIDTKGKIWTVTLHQSIKINILWFQLAYDIENFKFAFESAIICNPIIH